MSENQLDRIDPELRSPLEELLDAYPGGIYAIPDLGLRRRLDAELVAQLTSGSRSSQRCATADVTIHAGDSRPPVPARVYRPSKLTTGAPAIFFIHGGGMQLGGLDSEHGTALTLCERLGAVVVSTGYRKAPEHPHPAPIDDCFTSYTWMQASADTLGFDPERLAIYGGSAGGNLALATALRARDESVPLPTFVMAPYPMVDHRNDLPSTHEVTHVGAWDRRSNVEAWDWFLAGQEPDGYAAPLHARDLSGLPPIFIDVGTVDAFRDEDITFALRLLQAGVPTELHVYPGAYHGSELFAPEADLSLHMVEVRFRALRRHLGIVE